MMTFDNIVDIALDPDLVKAISGIEAAVNDCPSARRFICTNAILFMRQQNGFETQITKALMDEAYLERSTISPIVHAEAE